MSLIDADFLESLGVTTAGGNDKNIRAYCPVHHLVKGRPDSHPSWYMNTSTGAWLCFSCNQAGSLRMLVDLMGLDPSLATDVSAEMTKATVRRWQQDDDEDDPEPEAPKVFISEYGFNQNPYPPKIMRAKRDIMKTQCETYNVRWSIEGRCFLIPVYEIGPRGPLLGWQEKSKGYFNNVPEGMEKSKSLFGYTELYNTNRLVLVESPLDVLRMARHGLKGALATYGSYVSSTQLEALTDADLRVREVVLAFDNDEAGHAAMEHCARSLRGAVRVLYCKYPSKKLGKDPGEWPYAELLEAIGGATSVPLVRSKRK